MSTLVDLLPQAHVDSLDAESPVVARELAPTPSPAWDPESFAAEQIDGLVHQVFLRPHAKPTRQVVFSAIERGLDVGSICARVGQALCEQSRQPTCVVQIGSIADEVHGDKVTSDEKKFGTLRDSGKQLTGSLWFLPPDLFAVHGVNGRSAGWLRGCLAELRLEFEYSIFQAPPLGLNGQAALLGGLCDGVVLLVEANKTRRAAAQAVKQRLASMHVRLLGAILCERTFPIPERLYRRL